jgi:hypothetical protein
MIQPFFPPKDLSILVPGKEFKKLRPFKMQDEDNEQEMQKVGGLPNIRRTWSTG